MSRMYWSSYTYGIQTSATRLSTAYRLPLQPCTHKSLIVSSIHSTYAWKVHL
jgi:hypothetical protein